MKSFLKKLHIKSNHSPLPTPTPKSDDDDELNKPVSSSSSLSSSITGWLNSVTTKKSQSPKSTQGFMEEEERQVQLALELSAKEDPEAVQIEAVKEISCLEDNRLPDVVSSRYWNYSALSYDDKIVDGFYDLYGVLAGPTSSKMPSLVELQGTPVSDNVTWEAVLVNKAADSKLSELEQRALEMAV
ncbi:hypothetical protein M8C21_033572, partial [Ambrosia artemisiifolia]